MDFVKNDELIGMAFEKIIRISQPRAIPLCFKIELDRGATVTNCTGQSGFSGLAWSDQCRRCLKTKGLVQAGHDVTLNHPCRLKTVILICEDKSRLPGCILDTLAD